MSRELTVEELREKPDALIDAIENGETVTIVRDGKEIGTAAPPGLRIVHKGVPYPFRDIHITPLSKPLTFDPVEELIKDRERDRSGVKWRS
jgi:hypothetical protein